jgi:transposase
MKRLQITHTEITAEKLREELTATSERRKAIKLLGLLKVIEGEENQDTARFLEVERHTIGIWVKRVNAYGLAGLEERRGRGRKAGLDLNQKEALKKVLLESPRALGFRENLWSGRVLAAYILKKYGVTYQLSTMYVLFKELGYTLQRPKRTYVEANVEKQIEFKESLKKNNGLRKR